MISGIPNESTGKKMMHFFFLILSPASSLIVPTKTNILVHLYPKTTFEVLTRAEETFFLNFFDQYQNIFSYF